MTLEFNAGMTVNTKDEWLTPPGLLAKLGVFDLDPCSPINKPWNTAGHHFTIKDNGLNSNWFGRVWLNPPYGRETFKWLELLAKHKSGLALIFARTETIGFHKTVWNKAHSIFFFKGRISFYHIDGTRGNAANAPSCLISYSKEDSDILKNTDLTGKFIDLKNSCTIT